MERSMKGNKRLAIEYLNSSDKPPGQILCAGERDSFLHCLELSEDGRYIAALYRSMSKTAAKGGGESSLYVWNRDTGKEPGRIFASSYNSIRFCKFNGATCIAAGSETGRIDLLNPDDMSLVHELGKHNTAISALGVKDGGDIIASGDRDGYVKVWDPALGSCVFNKKLHWDVCEISFVPGYPWLVSTGVDDSVGIVDYVEGTCLGELDVFPRKLYAEAPQVNCVAFSRTDRRLFVGIEYPIGIGSGGFLAPIWVWDLGKNESRRFKEGHARGITCLEAHGDFLLSGGYDNLVKLWDIKTGECLKTLEGHQSYIEGVAFARHGPFFLSGGCYEGMIQWDAETGCVLKKYKPVEDILQYMSPLSGCTLAVAVYFRTVAVIDYERKEMIYSGKKAKDKCIYRIVEKKDGYEVSGVREAEKNEQVADWIADNSGKIALKFYDSFIDVWVLDDTGVRRDHASGMEGEILSKTVFLSDMLFVVRRRQVWGCDVRLVRRGDWERKQYDRAVGLIEMQETYPDFTHFYPFEGMLVSAHKSCGIKLWRAFESPETLCLPGCFHTGFEIIQGDDGQALKPVGIACFNPYEWKEGSKREVSKDNQLIRIDSEDGRTRIFSIKSVIREMILKDSLKEENIVVFNKDGSLCLSGGHDEKLLVKAIKRDQKLEKLPKIQLKDIRTGKCSNFGPSGEKTVFLKADADFSYAVAGNSDGSIFGISLAKSAEIPEEKKSAKCVISGAGDFLLVSRAEDGDFPEFKLYSVDKMVPDGCRLETIAEINELTGTICLDHDSASLFTDPFNRTALLSVAAQGKCSLILYDLATGNPRKTLKGHLAAPAYAVFSRDGKLAATGGNDQSMILWDVPTFSQKAAFNTYNGSVRPVFLYDNGNVLVQRTFGGYELYNACNGKISGAFRRSAVIPEIFVCFLENGRHLVSRSGFEICIFDAADGSVESISWGHTDVVTVCDVNEHKWLMASAQWFGRDIFLRGIFDSKPVSVLKGHTGEVTALRFFQKGQYLLSGSTDCTLKIWDTDSLQCLGSQWLGSPVKHILPVQSDKVFVVLIEDHAVLLKVENISQPS